VADGDAVGDALGCAGDALGDGDAVEVAEGCALICPERRS
jgi:hypothetical protein